MAINQTGQFIEYLRRSVRYDGAGRTDGQLLDSFVHHKDAAALAALVRRHGSMVWGVCRRTLRNHHDAEDAFQAAFLVLVQKATTLPDKETVGNWLYGVAQQTAVRMRALAAKRGVRERQVAVPPEPASAEQYVWNDLLPVLDEELSRLPEKYRVLIVLCDLEDRTRKEVARRLAIPEGTVASRLATARAMLAKRLAGRGVIVSGGLLGTLLAQQAASACLPTTLVSSTIKTAALAATGRGLAGTVSPTVATLMIGVTQTMFMSKTKVMSAVVLVAGLALGGVGVGVGLSPKPTAAAQQSGPGPGGDNARAGDREKPRSAPGVVQIRVAEPPGMNLALWPEAGEKDRAISAQAPGRLTLEQGRRSRLKLSGIPNRPGAELFPTVEIPRLAATARAFVTSSAIPIDFTEEDFDTAAQGGVTTKVVFLEKGRPTTLVSHHGTEQSPLEEARKRGMVLAVVRIGNILLGAVEPVRRGQEGLLKIEIGDDGGIADHDERLSLLRSAKGRDGLLEIEVGDDSKRPAQRSDQGTGKVAPEDEKTLKVFRQAASLMEREAKSLAEELRRAKARLQEENKTLRQQVKVAEVEVRSVRDALAVRDQEIRKLEQELRRARERLQAIEAVLADRDREVKKLTEELKRARDRK